MKRNAIHRTLAKPGSCCDGHTTCSPGWPKSVSDVHACNDSDHPLPPEQLQASCRVKNEFHTPFKYEKLRCLLVANRKFAVARTPGNTAADYTLDKKTSSILSHVFSLRVLILGLTAYDQALQPKCSLDIVNYLD
ncbi:unnamed protein product [Somion occarium]|uniref:Uncharacterized protein n=1 Tax=Somion occarium TaxID=3059160 RepID=A0ABP1DAN9_9APHY